MKTMNYWIDLFTGTTWDEFRTAGAKISGFRARMRKIAGRVMPGDIFLCYLTGVMRWVGALEIVGPSEDKTRIWKGDEFPVRFEVRPLVMLNAEQGVPMQELQGRVEFFKGPKEAGKFRGFVRMSPNRFRNMGDGELILQLLHQAQREPVTRPVDVKKLARKPLYRVVKRKGKVQRSTVVSVPEAEEATMPSQAATEAEGAGGPSHTEIQYYLLSVGAEMGLDVWVARNDRSKIWNGVALGSVPRVIEELPTQFNEATTRTVELIDVLWLRGNSIVAAFEVESTTSVYSGLLRMSDLLALQPNLDIQLFLVAPDDRRSKVEQEILRPTFNLQREKPLAEVCGLVLFSKLVEQVSAIRKLGLASSLKPDFVKKMAEYFPSQLDS
jgi:hypothetical protein